jgi:1-acyl-sn-glycerol-3-phosphate acyltransferase
MNASMLIARSLLFNVVFYVHITLRMMALLPLLPFSRKGMVRGVQAWARDNLRLLKLITGTGVEFRGLERLPPGAVLVASKHQSTWETFALLTILNDPTFVLKRELMWVPLFGWLAAKAGMVPVNRGAGSSALADMNQRAREEAARGRQIVIFPEGTRRAPGAEPAYKFGIAHLYGNLDIPCVPVALNSGLFWPRRRFIRRPGTILVEVLEPIPAGLGRKEFMDELQARLETASTRLLAEGQAQLRGQERDEARRQEDRPVL